MDPYRVPRVQPEEAPRRWLDRLLFTLLMILGIELSYLIVSVVRELILLHQMRELLR